MSKNFPHSRDYAELLSAPRRRGIAQQLGARAIRSLPHLPHNPYFTSRKEAMAVRSGFLLPLARKIARCAVRNREARAEPRRRLAQFRPFMPPAPQPSARRRRRGERRLKRGGGPGRGRGGV